MLVLLNWAHPTVGVEPKDTADQSSGAGRMCFSQKMENIGVFPGAMTPQQQMGSFKLRVQVSSCKGWNRGGSAQTRGQGPEPRLGSTEV